MGYRALARKRMWAWSIKRVANVWQNCIEVNGKAGPVVDRARASDVTITKNGRGRLILCGKNQWKSMGSL